MQSHGVPADEHLVPGREHDVVIELGHLRPALLRAARLFAETVIVPTALLFVLLHTVGLVAGLSAVLGWCALTLGIRWLAGRHLPGTLLLCVGMLCGRACLALVLSSALVYLLQPVVGSALMAVLFLGSAAVGRPVMSIGLLHWGVDAGLLSRGLFSGVLTALTIAVCVGWGWRAMHRIPGVTLRLRAPVVPA